MLHTVIAATSGDVTKAGKAIALALGIGLGSLGAGIGIGNIFGSMIQSVARQPELRGELQGIPGLMVWTIVAFGITFFVLRRYAFAPIQKLIDERREQIRRSIEEADNARQEARD